VSGQKQINTNVPLWAGNKLFLENLPWGKNKKHRVGLSVRFLVNISFFSILPQRVTFYFGSVVCFFTLGGNVPRISFVALALF
jgi:hypothetical protein